jgi:transposase
VPLPHSYALGKRAMAHFKK